MSACESTLNRRGGKPEIEQLFIQIDVGWSFEILTTAKCRIFHEKSLASSRTYNLTSFPVSWGRDHVVCYTRYLKTEVSSRLSFK